MAVMTISLGDARTRPQGWALGHWPQKAAVLLRLGAVADPSFEHDLGGAWHSQSGAAPDPGSRRVDHGQAATDCDPSGQPEGHGEHGCGGPNNLGEKEVEGAAE